MQKALSLIPYVIFPAKLGGQKGIALFNEYFSRVFPLCAVTVEGNDPCFASYPVYNILATNAYRYANPWNFFRVRTIIRKEGISHLIIEHPYFGWLGIMLKYFTGVKLVVHSHNIESTRWKTLGKWWWKLLWWYEGAVHRRADFNFFIHDNDRKFAIKAYGVLPPKAITATYGIEWSQAPNLTARREARTVLIARYQLDIDCRIFLFNGSLGYAPNLAAVNVLLEKVNPILQESTLDYRIIICGSGLPEAMNELSDYKERKIIYAGFVDDIGLYFKGSDLFLNPVIEGGGIKTKLVEALGYGTRALSTANGSIGIKPEDCAGMLSIVADDDWQEFASQTLKLATLREQEIPGRFFEKFYWGNIARKAAEFISS